MTRLAFLAISILFAGAPLAAEPMPAAVKELHAKLARALREEIRTAGAGASQEKQRLLDSLQQPRDYDPFRPGDLQRDAQRVALYFDSEIALDAAAKLETALETATTAAIAADVKEKKAKLQRIGETILKAKIPADLDAVMEEIATIPNAPYYSSDPDGSERKLLAEQLAGSRGFVTLWQDYLLAKKADDPSLARSVLKRMLDMQVQALPIPRSKVIELYDQQASEEQEAIRLVNGIGSLDDIRGVLATLARSKEEGMNSAVRVSLVQSLVAIDGKYREFLSGTPTNLEAFSYSIRADGAAPAKMAELRSALLKLILPRYLDAPAGAAAGKTESVNDFLERLTSEAKSRDDLALAYRARQALAYLNRGEKAPAADAAAYGAFLSAENQERAAQYSLAVFSYQQCLKSGSDLTPPELIGKRLESIRSQHSDDYQQGMERFMQTLVPERKN